MKSVHRKVIMDPEHKLWEITRDFPIFTKVSYNTVCAFIVPVLTIACNEVQEIIK